MLRASRDLGRWARHTRNTANKYVGYLPYIRNIDKRTKCGRHIDMVKFEWDEQKNQLNKKKHGIEFEEAQTAFSDSFGRLMSDPDHSSDEDRYILIGISYRLRMLIVCHCYRQQNDVIRIISARKANFEEIKQYERNLP